MLIVARLAVAILCAQALPARSSDGDRREALVDALSKQFSRIKSVHVVTHMIDDLPGRPDGAFVRAELKVYGSDRFFLDFSHGFPSARWSDDYTRHRSFIVGRDYLAEKPAMRTFTRRDLLAGEIPERFAVHPFFVSSGWWPQNAVLPCPEVMGIPISVLLAAQNENYRIETGSDPVVGHSSVILKRDGIDRIWLDPDSGLAVRARDWYDPEHGSICVMLRVDEFALMDKGLWAPSKCRILVSDGSSLDSESAAIIDRRSVQLVEACVNGVTPDEFVYHPAPGAFYVDRKSPDGWKQVEPGGLDFLELVADDIEARRSADVGGTESPWLALLACLAGAGLGLAGCACAPHRWRAPTTKRSL
jgi:hypothetical protein